jgi:hypothetical protein
MASNRPLLLVSGLGRCGSSLVMQMLRAGGLRVPGEYPFHEVDLRALDWSQYDAVKMMADQLGITPRAHKMLWMTRSPREQVASIVKVALAANPYAHRGLLLREAQVWRAITVPPHGATVLAFEGLVTDPKIAAQELCRWAGIPLARAPTMAAVVHVRSAKCEPGLTADELASLPSMMDLHNKMRHATVPA